MIRDRPLLPPRRQLSTKLNQMDPDSVTASIGRTGRPKIGDHDWKKQRKSKKERAEPEFAKFPSCECTKVLGACEFSEHARVACYSGKAFFLCPLYVTVDW